jgi:Lipopolysaccharide-assembly, LptC-related
VNLTLRNVLIVTGALFLAWIIYELYRAGGDISVPPKNPVTTIIKHGTAVGDRLHLRSWELDYDSITIGPDGITNTLENVRDGRYYKNGKPYAAMKAKHIVVNTVSNDFVEKGPIEVREIDGKHKVTFTSDAAIYEAATQTLMLNNPTTILYDNKTIHVDHATFNFKTRDIKTGHLTGVQ